MNVLLFLELVGVSLAWNYCAEQYSIFMSFLELSKDSKRISEDLLSVVLFNEKKEISGCFSFPL